MNPVAGVMDCLSVVFWTAGVLVSQFDKGRKGSLPILTTETGKALLQEMREEREKQPAPKKPTAQVIGFR